MSASTSWQLGPYRIDFEAGQLFRAGEQVRLRAKTFAVLRHLIERPGKVVPKEELFAAIWSGTHTSETVLKVCVRELRQALGDSAERPCFVETVHGRGYRFVGLPGGGPSSPPFVGRRIELERLRGAFEGASSGVRFVLVGGEPGVGKSALLGAFEAWSRSRGVRVASVRCPEPRFAEPCGPLLDAFAALGRGPGGAEVLATLERAAPLWAERLSGRASGGEGPLGATAARARRELYAALEALGGVGPRPLVLLFDDAQAADEATRALLLDVAREGQRLPLLLVVARRGEGGWGAAAGRRGRPIEEIVLGSLDRAEVGHLLSLRFAGAEAPARLIDVLFEKTAGLPFFVEHLIDALSAEGALGVEGGELRGSPERIARETPGHFRHLLASSFEGLDADARRLLEAASVVGVEFSARALGAASRLPSRRVDTFCEGLARSGRFLERVGPCDWPRGPQVGRYRFRHALHAEMLAGDVRPALRARIQARVGRRLERVYAGRTGPVAGELAQRFEAAGEAGRALGHWRAYAQGAEGRFAHVDAKHALERALALVERAGAQLGPEIELELWHDLGRLYRATGESERARSLLTRLAAEAESRGLPALRARALMALAEPSYAASHEGREALVRAALASAERASDPRFEAYVRSTLAMTSYCARGFRAEWGEACEDALRRFDAFAPDSLLATVACNTAYFRWLRADYRGALEAAEIGERSARLAGSVDALMRCLLLRAHALRSAGRWREALATAREGITLAERNGDEVWANWFAVQRAYLVDLAGDHSAATAVCERGVARARAFDHPTSELLATLVLASARLGDGDVEAAELLLAPARGRDAAGAFDHCLRMQLRDVLARLALGRGDGDAAALAAGRLRELADPPGERTWLALADETAARALVSAGHPAEARRRAARALEYVEGGAFPLAAWRVHAACARLDEARGRESEAKRHWRASAATLSELGTELEDEPSLQAAFFRAPLVRRALEAAGGTTLRICG